MKVLLVGSGGREDALAWALSRSPDLSLLRSVPGSAGLSRRADCLPFDTTDVGALAEHARRERYDLVVVGPEAPLVGGLADHLARCGVPVFGPSAAAARLEGSKVFAKEFMRDHGIPTASFRVFDEVGAARSFLRSREATYPLVLKADGLAAGKGVFVVDEPTEAECVAEALLVGQRLGAAGSRLVIEERLVGPEVSFFVLSDGERVVPLAACQDYKRVLDGDRGPNTGGMGAYSPSVFLDEPARASILDTVVRPTIRGMASAGHPYRGVLYVGLMLTESGPRVLEFNARFGDPETQVLMPRLDGDWLHVLRDCAHGKLDATRLRWRNDAAVCVVMASEGYPERHRTGQPIRGLDEAEALEGVLVFHAGTALGAGGGYVTAGGRVLGVTGVGGDLATARGLAYEAVARIRWDGEQHRGDIALDALAIAGGRNRS